MRSPATGSKSRMVSGAAPDDASRPGTERSMTNQIDAGAAAHQVGIRPAGQRVGAIAAIDRVGAVPAEGDVVARAALQAVRPVIAPEQIVAIIAAQRVEAEPAEQHVRRCAADQHVAVIRRLGLGGGGVGGEQRVPAIAAIEPVAARTAAQFIGKVAAQQRVAAEAAIQPIDAIAAREQVVAGLPPDGVVGGAEPGQHVIAIAAEEAAELGGEIGGVEPRRGVALRHRHAQQQVGRAEAPVIVEVGPHLEAPGLAFDQAPQHIDIAIADLRRGQLQAGFGIALEGEVGGGDMEGDDTRQRQRAGQQDAVAARRSRALEIDDQVGRRRAGFAARRRRSNRNRSSPAPPTSRSMPAPPSRLSSPQPPDSVSSPAPPARLSARRPPVSTSPPAPPSSATPAETTAAGVHHRRGADRPAPLASTVNSMPAAGVAVATAASASVRLMAPSRSSITSTAVTRGRRERDA